jgi:hypothetical protein
VKPVDSKLVSAFLDRVSEHLAGDWVVIGGAVLPLVGIEHRVTWDIDLAGPEDAPQTLEVLELASDLGLPVEAVNQAGAFFLRRIEGWRDHLVPVRKTARASVSRPDATLYVRLKLSRLSEADLADCVAYVGYARAHGEPLDAPALRKAIRKEIRVAPSSPRRSRLRALSAAI